MAMRFSILGSGSSGNCALLQTDDARILVDAGFSARKLDGMLAGLGEKLENIDAILLTHEHGDHSAAIAGLARHPQIRVFANGATSRSMQRTLKHQVAWNIFETGATFRFRDLEISSFSVPHDAQDPVGFVIAHGDDDLFSARRSLAWLTDLGHAPQHVRERIREVDVLVVEANHCPQMLEADTKRPWSLKQRISGRHGHLSNAATRELLGSVDNPRWRHVFFAHLSRDCNSTAAVGTACTAPLAARQCGVTVVPAGGGTPFHDL